MATETAFTFKQHIEAPRWVEGGGVAMQRVEYPDLLDLRCRPSSQLHHLLAYNRLLRLAACTVSRRL